MPVLCNVFKIILRERLFIRFVFSKRNLLENGIDFEKKLQNSQNIEKS